MKFVDIRRKAESEGNYLALDSISLCLCGVTDAEMRRRGDQKGLETLVVHAVNDEDSLLAPGIDFTVFCGILGCRGLANALNLPPEEYDRKVKTQRNRRGLIQVVEHVV